MVQEARFRGNRDVFFDDIGDDHDGSSHDHGFYDESDYLTELYLDTLDDAVYPDTLIASSQGDFVDFSEDDGNNYDDQDYTRDCGIYDDEY